MSDVLARMRQILMSLQAAGFQIDSSDLWGSGNSAGHSEPLNRRREARPEPAPGLPGGRCLNCADGLILWQGHVYSCLDCDGFGTLPKNSHNPGRYYMGPIRGVRRWWERARPIEVASV